MIRARPVAGDLALGQRLLDLLAPAVWDGGLSAEDVREIRRLKARVERERMPTGEDPAFHLKLGRGSLSDIEFTAQLLQLRHGVAGTATVATLESLATAAALDRADADILIEAYRFCEGTRNRWYLVNSSPGDSLPSQPNELLWLARSLGTTPTELPRALPPRDPAGPAGGRARLLRSRLSPAHPPLSLRLSPSEPSALPPLSLRRPRCEPSAHCPPL